MNNIKQLNPNIFSYDKNFNNLDPRLRNNVTGQFLSIDRPPYITIHQDGNYNNGNFYYDPKTKSTYSLIDKGNIFYYSDNQTCFPFPKQSFNSDSIITKNLEYMDPMDNNRPQYNFIPIKDNKNGLSFINDTIKNREELMALQRRKYNESKYIDNF